MLTGQSPVDTIRTTSLLIGRSYNRIGLDDQQMFESHAEDTHISRLGHPHTSVQSPSFEGASHDEICILHLVELRGQRRWGKYDCEAYLVPHGLDSLRVQCTGSESEIGQFDVTGIID
jgi:hypothetical protein